MRALATTALSSLLFCHSTLAQAPSAPTPQTEADFRRARDLIIGTGALDATLDLAADYADKAKSALSMFPANDWREALEDLADFAVSRLA